MTRITPVNADGAPQYAEQPGPIQSRKCRDVFWLILFVAYWVGMAILAILAIVNGNPNRLYVPTDSNGNQCGLDTSSVPGGANLILKPYLYFFDPTSGTAAQVCVDACPSATGLSLYSSGNYVCQTGSAPTSASTLLSLQNSGKCTAVVYASSPVLNRCMPSADLAVALAMGLSTSSSSASSTATTLSTVSTIMGTGLSLARGFIQDFMTTWQWMLGALGCCVVACFIWLFLLRFIGGFLTYLTLFAVEIGLGAMAWYTYTLWQAQVTANAALASPTAAQQQQQTVNMVLFIVCASLAGIFLLMMIAMRKRIRIAVRIIKEASKAVAAMPMIVVFPITSYIAIIVLSVYYLIIAIYIETTNDVTKLTLIGSAQTVTFIKYFQWYHLFGFLWTLALIVAVNQTTIAGAIASWYWSRDKQHLPRLIVIKSLWRSLRYSLGSLALGSFLIAVVQLIRVILMYIQRQLRGTGNRVAQLILSCLQCCFWCLEKFIAFLNKNAYIMISVNGESFCTSARKAAELLVRNAFRLVAVDFVSGFILFLSKLVVAGSTAFGLYALLQYTGSTSVTSVQSPAIVCLVVLVAAWMVVSCFFGVYRMAIDTVFLSFCEDCERNDGTAAKPYFMSPELAQLLAVKPQGAPDIASDSKKAPAKMEQVKKSGHQ
ncbi:plasma-membrane choline transporter-domain-containing protein [Blastocladiella britannica]|nr:plasma-membrane choline transporter-domain-containing protein [Blastocladiella britannica]